LISIASKKLGGVWFALVKHANKIIACSFSEESQKKAETAVQASISPHDRPVRNRLSASPAEFQELYELYMGRRRADLRSIDLSHVSPFRRRAYSLLCRIPRGRVTTYGMIAERLESRRYARAVGTAVGSNLMPLLIGVIGLFSQL
jgi:O6-methylguanine-DNA--protein-cysteine methyltransferase